jgi:mRNA interferase MazF
MKRGDIWTVAGGKDYAGKPRPAVIIQEDSFDASNSVTICLFTTSDEIDAPLFRLPVEANEKNGLRAPSRMMVDKITTLPRSKANGRIGRLDDEDILRLNRAMLVFLGLAVSPRVSGVSRLGKSVVR